MADEKSRQRKGDALADILGPDFESNLGLATKSGAPGGPATGSGAPLPPKASPLPDLSGRTASPSPGGLPFPGLGSGAEPIPGAPRSPTPNVTSNASLLGAPLPPGSSTGSAPVPPGPSTAFLPGAPSGSRAPLPPGTGLTAAPRPTGSGGAGIPGLGTLASAGPIPRPAPAPVPAPEPDAFDADPTDPGPSGDGPSGDTPDRGDLGGEPASDELDVDDLGSEPADDRDLGGEPTAGDELGSDVGSTGDELAARAGTDPTGTSDLDEQAGSLDGADGDDGSAAPASSDGSGSAGRAEDIDTQLNAVPGRPAFPRRTVQQAIDDVWAWYRAMPILARLAAPIGLALVIGVVVVVILSPFDGPDVRHVQGPEPLQAGPGDSAAFPRVALLERNESVEVLDARGDWTLVNDDLGRIGWVRTMGLADEWTAAPPGAPFTLCRRRLDDPDGTACATRAERQFESCRLQCTTTHRDPECLVTCAEAQKTCSESCANEPPQTAVETAPPPVEQPAGEPPSDSAAPLDHPAPGNATAAADRDETAGAAVDEATAGSEPVADTEPRKKMKRKKMKRKKRK